MQSLKGQFLVAMPSMSDPRFAQSVIYLVEHNNEGSMGLVINATMDDVSFADILGDLNLLSGDDVGRVLTITGDVPVLRGGPVDSARGFVLHSDDFFDDGASLHVSSSINLTANHSVLKAIASGSGKPRHRLFALGYAGWGPGQLEDELSANAWLNVPASSNIMFDAPPDQRYKLALAQLGLTAANLSAASGLA